MKLRVNVREKRRGKKGEEERGRNEKKELNDGIARGKGEEEGREGQK